MSGRPPPLLALTLPVLTVLAICLYLRYRQRREHEPQPPDPPAYGPVQQTSSKPEPVQQTASEPVQQTASEPEPVQQTASEPVKQTASESVQQTAPEPVQQTASEPEPVQQTVSEPEPVQQTASEPVQQTASEPVQQTASEPEPVQQTASEPVKQTASESVQQTASEPVQQTASELVQQMSSEPAIESPISESDSVTVTSSLVQREHLPPDKLEKAACDRPQPGDVGAGGDSVLSQIETVICPKQAESLQNESPPGVPEAILAAHSADVAAVGPDDAVAGPDVAAAESKGSGAAGPGVVRPAGIEQAEASRAAAADGAGAGQQPEAGSDNASENSSDSGKGGSSLSLEQSSPSASPESIATHQHGVFDFLIPQKLCGRLIGKNGTFVHLLKARTGANVIVRLHPVKTAVKICSVQGTQTEIDSCLGMIREKFPVQKFPAMKLERLSRPPEQTLAVPVSQQLHLPQGVTCDVLVSAVVCPGQLFVQQHTHPTFRGLERLNALMTACYTSGDATPELPRPVQPSSICAAPVLDGWYRAQVVAFYPDTDQVDVRFMDYGGYSRIEAASVRQIRTDFMSLPFQAEECYLANVIPTNDETWSLEENAVFESLITERALEAMVVGYAEDGTPFINLYSIQGTEYGNSAIAMVNRQLVESGAARWVENHAQPAVLPTCT